MGTIRELEGALQLVLDASATEQGLTSDWQLRQGRVSPRQFVQTLVFGFLEDPHATLNHLARVAHALGALVTPQALSQRFSARSVTLLAGVLRDALRDALGVLLAAEPVAAPVWRGFPGGAFRAGSSSMTPPKSPCMTTGRRRGRVVGRPPPSNCPCWSIAGSPVGRWPAC